MRYALLLISFLPAIVRAAPLHGFVSVLPIKTCVEKVGGERVDVRAMVRPGYNPITYDPTPRQIGALAEAVLYVRAGIPFEIAWMDRSHSLSQSQDGDPRRPQRHRNARHGGSRP